MLSLVHLLSGGHLCSARQGHLCAGEVCHLVAKSSSCFHSLPLSVKLAFSVSASSHCPDLPWHAYTAVGYLRLPDFDLRQPGWKDSGRPRGLSCKTEVHWYFSNIHWDAKSKFFSCRFKNMALDSVSVFFSIEVCILKPKGNLVVFKVLSVFVSSLFFMPFSFLALTT